MKIPNYVLIITIVSVFSTGMVFGDHGFLPSLDVVGESVFRDKVSFRGEMLVEESSLFIQNGNLEFGRSNGMDQLFAMRTSNGSNTIDLIDTDTNDHLLMRVVETGDQFELIMVPSDLPPTFILVGNENGNVGIGTQTPSEKLDINGDVKLSGVNPRIYSDGDICIGQC